MRLWCEIKDSWCASPVNCRDCQHFEHWTAIWACPSCVRHFDRTAPHYQAGKCERCGTHSIMLVALDLSSSGTSSGR